MNNFVEKSVPLVLEHTSVVVCILDAAGQVLVHRNVKSSPEAFFETVAPYRAGIEKKHGQGKALSILAHTIGRAVFDMLSRGTVFSMEKCLAAERRRERASQTSHSSQVGTELVTDRNDACAAARHEPSIMRQGSGSGRA